MKLLELFENNFNKIVQYHKTLNPKLWENNKLKPVIGKKLLKIAKEFIEFIDIEDLKIEDIIIAGSNVNYNYTKLSDIDLHLITNFKKLPANCSELAENFFKTKKNLWNKSRNIKILNYTVELYVQDVSEPLNSSGIYSLENDKWIKKPSYTPPSINDFSIISKYNSLEEKIDNVIKNNENLDEATDLLKKIYEYRKEGLVAGGEFSSENLIFKMLRNNDLLDKLRDYITKKKDKELSL